MLDFSNTFFNLFKISPPFSGGIIISSTGSCFSILTSFGLVRLCKFITYKFTTLWEPVFTAFSPVFNNCFSYFLANDKNPYPLIYFFVLGYIEHRRISVY